MSTNGTMLNDETIKRLGSAGLNYLNVSVDTFDNHSVSKKNALFDKDIVTALNSAKKNHGLKPRMNGVIYNNNFHDVKLLLELSKESTIPLSFGFIVPYVNDVANDEIYFSEKDTELLSEIVDYILQKKKEKYPVIDPDSYFTNVFKFIKHENFWKCNYPGRYGRINVTTNGTLRSCTKKMDDTGIDFLSLTPVKIKSYKKSLEPLIEECNRYCYSNCAYDSSFFKDNKVAFLFNNI